MTSRRVTAGFKTYLAAGGMALSGLTFVTAEESGDKAYPLGIIEVTGMEEHEVLDGVYTLSVDVHLETDPERTATADAQTAMDEIYCLLGATGAVKEALNREASLTCYDAYGVNQITSPDDGRRRTTVSMIVVAAEI